MAYIVTEETIRLVQEVNDLARQENRLTKMADDLWADITRKQVQHGDLLLALGEVRTLLRQKEDEERKAFSREG